MIIASTVTEHTLCARHCAKIIYKAKSSSVCASSQDTREPRPCRTIVRKNMETLAPPTGHKKFAICDRSSCENGAFRKAGGKECSFMVAESALGVFSGLKIHLNFVISLSSTGSSNGSSLLPQGVRWPQETVFLTIPSLGDPNRDDPVTLREAQVQDQEEKNPSFSSFRYHSASEFLYSPDQNLNILDKRTGSHSNFLMLF
ncbi:hypothetical protein MUG91_G95n97 [Manis pentadactyla]|nr:hypothetical protein MUG91_G95n97 [Manis pentadactyla]